MRGERDALAGLSVEQLDAQLAENEAAGARLREAKVRATAAAAAAAAVAEATLCSICQERPRDCVLNCGHTFCRTCAGRMTTCPQRCGAITSRGRFFD